MALETPAPVSDMSSLKPKNDVLVQNNTDDDSTVSLAKNSQHSQDGDGKPSRLVVTLTLASSISGFMFGYDTGYISSALVQVGTDLLNKILTSGDKSLITSATSLGALLGAIVGGVAANLVGRKRVLLASNVVFILGTIIQLAAKTVWTMMSAGLCLAGVLAPRRSLRRSC